MNCTRTPCNSWLFFPRHCSKYRSLHSSSGSSVRLDDTTTSLSAADVQCSSATVFTSVVRDLPSSTTIIYHRPSSPVIIHHHLLGIHHYTSTMINDAYYIISIIYMFMLYLSYLQHLSCLVKDVSSPISGGRVSTGCPVTSRHRRPGWVFLDQPAWYESDGHLPLEK